MLFALLLLTSQMIALSNLQNVRSLPLLIMNDTQYQCNGQNCVPSIEVYAANLRQCQMACTNYAQCRTVSYSLFDAKCEMFADISEYNGHLATQPGVITMTAVDSRRLSARE